MGYSCLAWAHAVGPDGVVTGLEFNPEYAQKAREAFKRFGVENVDIIEGDAVEACVTQETCLACPFGLLTKQMPGMIC